MRPIILHRMSIKLAFHFICFYFIFFTNIVFSQKYVTPNYVPPLSTSGDCRIQFIDSQNGWGTINGLQKTTNGGLYWQDINLPFEASSFAYFVSMTNGWMGGNDTVYRTTDGGLNWSASYADFQGNKPYKIKFIDANIGWAIGFRTRIYKTTNGGVTWSIQHDTLPALNLYDIDFIDPNNGWAVGSNGIIYHTNNGGTNWAKQNATTTNTLNAISAISSTTAWAVGNFQTIIKTTDAGGSWSGTWTTSGDNYLDVQFLDVNNGFIVGGQSLSSIFMSTTNGGSSWQTTLDMMRSSIYSVSFLSPTEGFVGGNAVMKTTNSGTSWSIEAASAYSGFYNVTTPDNVNFWTVGDYGSVIKSSDKGYSWQWQQMITPSFLSTLNGVSFVSSAIGWTSGSAGVIRKTTNGGSTWVDQSSSTVNNLNDIFFVDQNNGWASGQNGTIVRSTNGGSSWVSQTSGTTNYLYSILFLSTTTGFAGGDFGTLLKTTNGGSSWATITGITTKPIQDISFYNSQIGWICTYSGTNDEILKTTNGGQTWVSQYSNGSLFRNIKVLDSLTIVATTQSGQIYYSGDSGLNWNIKTTNGNPTTLGIDVHGSNDGVAVGGKNIFRFLNPPFSPKNLIATAGNGQVTLKWDKNSESDFLKYCIYIGNDSTTMTLKDSSTASISDTTKTITGLTNGTKYYFRVTGIDSSRLESGQSFAVGTTPTVLTAQFEYNADANTVLLMHMNEASGSGVFDASANSNNGTATGTTPIIGKFGSAKIFNGTSDLIGITNSSAANFGMSTSFTIETWLKLNGINGSSVGIITKGTSPTFVGYQLQLYSNNIGLEISTSTGNISGTTTKDINDNKYHHVALIIDRSFQKASIFIDGKLEYSTINAVLTGNIDNSGLFKIGLERSNSAFFKGIIDELRISNIARNPNTFNLQLPPINLLTTSSNTGVNLSWTNGGGATPLKKYLIYRGADSNAVTLIDSTTQLLYTNNGLPSGTTYFYRVSAVDSTGFEGARSFAVKATTLGLVAYYPFTGNAGDSSGNGNNGTVNGATLTTDRFGIANSSYSFTGSSYIQVPNSSSLQTSGTITINGWATITAYSDNPSIVSKGTSHYSYELGQSSQKILFSSSTTSYAGTSVLPLNKWVMITAVINGTDLKTYVNGQFDRQQTMGGVLTNDTQPMRIGVCVGGQFWNGKIDDIRIYNRTLSAFEIDSLYHLNGYGYPPTITSISPNRNALSVTRNSNITITFDSSMDVSTIVDSTFKVFGSLRGLYAGVITYNAGTKTITYNPAQDFFPGEKITVLVTNDVTNSKNIAIAHAMEYSFTAKADVATAVFNQTQSIATSLNPISSAVGDFDSDGDIDIAIANRSLHTVVIFKNNGNGILSESQNINIGNELGSIEMGDFNADRKIDLAVADISGTPKIFIFQNTGNGIFTTSPQSISLSARPGDLKIEDFNGDGYSDMTITNYGNYDGSSMQVFLNDGFGGFLSPQTVTIGAVSGSIATADFDNDGDIDIVISKSTSNAVTFLANNGSGAFSIIADISVGGYDAMRSADIDGDGYIDIIFPRYNEGGIRILKNNGNWTFTVGSDFATLTNPTIPTTGDVDGDGDLDLFLGENTGSQKVLLYKNTNGVFSSGQTITSGGSPQLGQLVDIDNDGDLDLVTIHGGSNELRVLKNNFTSGNVAFYPFTGNANDSSGIGNNGTNNGATLSTDRFGNLNKSYSFNGTSNYISIPNNATINFGNGDATIVAWVYPTNIGGSRNIISKYDGTGYQLRLIDGVLEIAFSSGNTLLSTTNIPTNQWSMVSFTAKSGVGSLYVNGTLVKQAAISATLSSSNNLNIGAHSIALQDYFSGAIDDIRIYNRGLSAIEIDSLYHMGGWAIGLIAYYPFTSNAGDSSGLGNNGTVNGATLTTDRFGNANKAYSFNGSTNYISTTNLNLPLGNSARTISAWVNLNSPSTINEIVGWGNFTTLQSSYLQVYQNRFKFIGFSSNLDGPSNVLANAWYNVAYTYDGSTGRLFVNGIEVANNSVALNTTSSNLFIGNDVTVNSTNAFNGKIDDIRIYNHALSASEIDSLYHLGGWANGLIAYYPFTSNAGDSSGFGNNGTVNGATLTTDRFGNANKAYSFNGSSNIISVSNSTIAKDASTENYTVSCWVKLSSVPPDIAHIINDRDGGTKCSIHLSYDNRHDVLAYNHWWAEVTDGNTSKLVRSKTVAQINSWYYVTQKVSNRRLYLYINGVVEDSLDLPVGYGSTKNNDGILTIGGRYNNGGGNYVGYFPGIVDDILIYNRALSSTEIDSLYHLNGYGYSPTIISFTPTSGPVGTTITITGTNFNTTASKNVVYFGGVRGSVLTASATQLSVSVPAGAMNGYITVIDTVVRKSAKSITPYILTFGNNQAITTSSFVAGSNITTGTKPYHVQFADLDNDTKPEMVIPNNLSGTISLFKNTSSTGTISFNPKTDLTTGGSPNITTSADLDNDGKLDVITSNGSAGTISIFRNTTVGSTISFASKIDLLTNGINHNVSAVDLNQDGLLDLVCSNENGTISIFQNISSGSSIQFTTKFDMTMGTGPCIALATGDLNGDNYPEIVVGNYNSGILEILQNISSGGSLSSASFASKIDITIANSLFSVEIADLDADGKRDIIASANSISILRNIASSSTLLTSSFATKVDLITPSGGTAIVYDLNGDGKLDIIQGDAQSKQISIFKNQSVVGNLTLSSFANRVDLTGPGTTTGFSTYRPGIADVDGDGRPDIAMENFSDGIVAIYKNMVPFSSGLIAYYPFNGNVNDSTGNGNNGTNNGATLTTDRFGNANRAYSFNGNSSFIQIPNSPSLLPGTGSYTFNGWFRLTPTNNGNVIYFFSMEDGINDYSGVSMFYDTTSHQVKFYFHYDDSFSHQTIASAPYSLNNWHQITTTLDRPNLIAKIYIDGVLVNTYVTNNNNITGSSNFQFGKRTLISALDGLYKGDQDDIRIYNRALSATEIDSLYHEGGWKLNIAPLAPLNLIAIALNQKINLKWNKVTDTDIRTYRIYDGTTPNPTTKIDSVATLNDTSKTVTDLTNGQIYYYRVTAVDSSGLESSFSNEIQIAPTIVANGLVAYYPFNGNANDGSGFKNDGVNNGAIATPDRFGNGNKAYSFNGSSNNIVVANNQAMYPTTSTISVWFKSNIWKNWNEILVLGNGIVEPNKGFSLTFDDVNNLHYADTRSSGLQALLLHNKSNFDYSTWNNVVIIRTNDSAKMYLNGNLVAIKNGLLPYERPVSNPLYIGSNSPGAVDYFNGIIDDIRIYNRALVVSEIDSLYREGGYKGIPATPGNLIATPNGSTVNLTWAYAGEASSLAKYKIYRGTDSTTQTLIDSTANTTYTNIGLTSGIKLFYRVSAVDTSGVEGTKSFASSATPYVPPSAPLQVTLYQPIDNAENLRTTQVLNWSRPTSTERFSLEVSSDPTFASEIIFKDTARVDSFYNISSLPNNDTVYWRVTALNSVGSSPVSEIRSFITRIATPVLVITILDTQQIKLKWNPIPGSIGYNVLSSNNGTVFSSPQFIASPAESTIIINLTPGSRYYYKIVALNGSAQPSDTSIAVNGFTRPSVPTNLVTVEKTDDKVKLSWNKGNGVVSGYRIYRSFNNAAYSLIAPTTQTFYTDSGLVTNSQYRYRIRSVNGANVESDTTSQIAVKTYRQLPRLLAVSSISGRSVGNVKIAFNLQVFGNDTAYLKLYYSTDGGTTFTQSNNTSGKDTLLFISGIDTLIWESKKDIPNKYFSSIIVKIIASNAEAGIDAIPYAQSTSSFVLDNKMPDFAGVQSVNPDSTRLVISWNEATDNSTPIKYNIYKSQIPTIDYNQIAATVTGTSATLSGLQNFTIYYLAVRAVDSLGNVDTNTVIKSQFPFALSRITSIDPIVGIKNGTFFVPFTYSVAFNDTMKITALYSVNGGSSFDTIRNLLKPVPLKTNSGFDTLKWQSDLDYKNESNNASLRIIPSGKSGTGIEKITSKFTLDNKSPDFNGLKEIVSDSLGTSIRITWMRATDISQPLTYYVYQSLVDGNLGSIIDSVKNDTSKTLNSLTTFTKYYFTVRVKDSLSNIEANNIQASIIPTRSVKVSSMNISQATYRDNLPIQFVLDASELDTARIELWYSLNGGTSWSQSQQIIGKTNSITSFGAQNTIQWKLLKEIPNIEIFNVQVKLVTYGKGGKGVEKISGAIAIDTKKPTFAGISSVKIDSTQNGVAVVTWSAATDTSKPIQYYIYSDSVDISFTTPIDSTDKLKWTSGYLVNRKNYQFAVRARDAVGNIDTNVTKQTFKVPLVADYDNNNKVDGIDVTRFVSAWTKKDVKLGDIGPVEGTVPDLISKRDNKIDFEDLMALGLMWEWSADHPAARVLAKLNKEQQQELPLTKFVFNGSTVLQPKQTKLYSPILEQSVDTRTIELIMFYDKENISIDSIGIPNIPGILFFKRINQETGNASIVVTSFNDTLISLLKLQNILTLKITALSKLEEEPLLVELNTYNVNGQLTSTLSKDMIFNWRPIVPEQFALSQNYPNPFNPRTMVEYQLPLDTKLTLKVYNILGQEVVTLFDGEQKAGYYTLQWDATHFASGLYLYRLQSKDFVQTKKMLLIK